ncbi:MAG: carboxypeptidase regulatory-like domain-containing protein [Pseudomonadota bacterium]
MRTPTDAEQLYLELINRARADPEGELDLLIADRENGIGVQANITAALDFWQVDIELLYSQLEGVAPVAPLAWSQSLGQSATVHSQAMINADLQAHNVPGEPPLGERITNAGYVGWSQVAENIFAFVEDPVQGHAAFFIDWGPGISGIQNPAGHRDTILNPLYREVGIGELPVPEFGYQIGPNSHTQHFGRRAGTDAFLTGVVIEDGDGDRFYDIGEGLGGVTVTASGANGTFSTATWESGGYTLELAPGSYTLTFSGGGLAGTISRPVTMTALNQKQDAVAGDAMTPGERIVGGSEDETLIGTPGPDTIIDRGGSNRLEGREDNDRLITGEGNDIALGEAGDDVIKTAGGNDTVEGGADNDIILSGVGDDRVFGDGGDDTLKASEGDDFVFGGPGDDEIFGWRGNDTVSGGAGDDVVRGDFDEDRLEGGPGNDRVQGGPGRDVFVFSDGFDEDRILDFNTALEKLDFRSHSLVNGLADLEISQVGTSVLILTPDSGRIVLANNVVETISAGDFIFV